MTPQVEPTQRVVFPANSGDGVNERSSVLTRGAARELSFAALYLTSLLFVVAAPVFAWLLVLGATRSDTVPSVAAPLWYLLVEGACAWLMSRLCRRQGLLTVAGVSMLPILCAYLALLRISPITATLASEEPSLLGWVTLGIEHLLAGPAAFPSEYALLALTIYIWWQCANDGARLPAYRRASGRFFWGLGVTMFAAVIALLSPAIWRPAIITDFMLLLPIFMVAGLLSLTLTRIAYERDIPDADPIFRASQWRQISYAVTLAAVFAAAAIVIATAAGPQMMGAFLVRLGLDHPANAVSHLLQQALNSLLEHIAGLFGAHPTHIQTGQAGFTDPSKAMCIKHPELPQCKPKQPTKLTPAAPMFFLPLLVGLAALLALCGAAVAVIRNRGIHGQRRERAEEVEERESLDALQILRQQARAMVRPRTRGTHRHVEGEPVRALYREVLRAAGARRLMRASDETPYEYAARLQLSPPFTQPDSDSGADLIALSDAYAEVRYGERRVTPADLPTLRGRVRRLKEALMRRS